MSYAAGVFLAVVAVCVAVMITVQVYEFLRGRSLLLGPRHLALRLGTGLGLVLIICCIYAGVLLTFPTPLAEMVYWGGLLVAAGVVAGLAVFDLRMVEQAKHQKKAELYRQLAETEARLRGPRDGKE